MWEGGQKDEDNSLRNALYNSLYECHSRQLSSVAVPAISSGIFGFPKTRCAKVLFSSALEFFRAEPKSSVDLVRFTNFDKATVEVFKEAVTDLVDESKRLDFILSSSKKDCRLRPVLFCFVFSEDTV